MYQPSLKYDCEAFQIRFCLIFFSLSLSLFIFYIALFYGFNGVLTQKSSNLLLTLPSKTHRIVIRVIDLDLLVFLQIWLFDRRLIQVFAVWFGFTGINDVLLRFGWLWRRSKGEN